MLNAYKMHQEVIVPLIQVRDFPQELYDRLQKTAEADRRSTAQQITVLLRQALDLPESFVARRQSALIDAAAHSQTTTINTLDPVELIREDRQR